MQIRHVAAAAMVLLTGALVWAQYQTGYEPPTYSTAPGGTILTGQENYFLPTQGGADFMVFAYSDPAGFMQVPNPRGSTQYVAGQSQGNNARTERAVTSWTNTGKSTVWYDMAATYSGSPANNIGSLSPRPDPNPSGPDTRNTYIQLFSFATDPNTGGLDPNHYQGLYEGYDATGAQLAQPGVSPGPAWDLLVFNNWYRYGTVLDFDTNTFTRATLIDLQTATGTTVNLTLDPNYPGAWYLEGGAAGSAGPPQGFRYFSGTPVGNTTAWDNICIAHGVGTGDLNCDGAVNFDDINPFVMLLSNPAGYQAAFPDCCIQNGDCNLDGVVNFDDINPFVALLSGH